MFNVHTVTFIYIRILPNVTLQQSIYIFNIVTMLFAVWVVNYEVMDLQKRHKFNRPYYLHTQFVMWEHE